MGVTVEIHGRIDAVAEGWEDLAERTNASPAFHPGWFRAWCEAFGGRGLELFAARDAGRIVGVLPVLREGRAVRSPTNWHTFSYGFLSEDADAARHLSEALLQTRGNEIHLQFVDPSDPGVASVIDLARRRGYRVLFHDLQRSPYITLDGGWDEVERRLGRSTRQEMRRRRRRLEERGTLSFEIHDGAEGLEDLLVEGFAIEGSGWKERRGSAVRSDPATEGFYRRLAEWARDRGWLRLAFLRLDGRPIAFDYSFEANGSYMNLKTGYEPAFSSYAPGLLLRADVVRRAFDIGLRTYEFLGADDPWKRPWASGYRERKRVLVFDRSLRGTAGWVVWRHGRPLARRLRRSTGDRVMPSAASGTGGMR